MPKGYLNMVRFPEQLQTVLDLAWETARKHAARMETSPHEAIHWINSSVEAAAQIHVLGMVRQACLDSAAEARNVTQESLLGFVDRQIDNLATHGAVKSTALLDGPLRAEELRAWTMVRKAFAS